MNCPRCGSPMGRNGRQVSGGIKFKCSNCHIYRTEHPEGHIARTPKLEPEPLPPSEQPAPLQVVEMFGRPRLTLCAPGNAWGTGTTPDCYRVARKYRGQHAVE